MLSEVGGRFAPVLDDAPSRSASQKLPFTIWTAGTTNGRNSNHAGLS